jgi:hypothetical protein
MNAVWFGMTLTDQEERSMSISQQIQAFHDEITKDDHHRYRSWEHCYGFFQRVGRQDIIAQRDDAAVQLGFYLASWGMYRGSSFLLQSLCE